MTKAFHFILLQITVVWVCLKVARGSQNDPAVETVFQDAIGGLGYSLSAAIVFVQRWN
ncbi:hypothetical protein J7M07_02320 [bacterium]|nr:hypothetical protein [bacterium]